LLAERHLTLSTTKVGGRLRRVDVPQAHLLALEPEGVAVDDAVNLRTGLVASGAHLERCGDHGEIRRGTCDDCDNRSSETR
jgi:hypothetical protein